MVDIWNELYVVLTGIFSCLSMIGTLIIIITYISYPDLRSRGRHFLVFLSVVDFLTAFGNMLGVIWTTDPKSFSDAYCKAHPAITTFSSVSSNLWNLCIAFFLYVTLVRGLQHVTNQLRIGFHVICWTIPSKFNVPSDFSYHIQAGALDIQYRYFKGSLSAEICGGLKNEIRCTHARTNEHPYNAFL